MDFKTFHDTTRAEFTPADTPDREPDFVSPAGSVYWDAGHGVFRSSDHWAGLNGCTGQASCVWSVLDAVRPGVWLTAYCAYADFRRRVWMPRLHTVTDRGRQVAADVRAGGGAYREDGHAPSPVPLWAQVNLRGSVHAKPEAQKVFAADPKVRRVITADAAAVEAVLAGAEEVPYGKFLY